MKKNGNHNDVLLYDAFKKWVEYGCSRNASFKYRYIASAKTKRYWLIHGHVALDKCNVSLGQQLNNCCPL